MRIRFFPLAVLLTMASATAQAALKIDGKIDEPEWSSAQRITDFRLTQPLSRAPSPYPTEVLVLSTAEGLAIAFRNTQPANVPHTRQVVQRDADAPTDRVNVYVDFDGEGRIGYNFMVRLSDSIQDETITNENQFNTDWDGNWQHAVSEDGDVWSVEILIPWYIAPMKDGHDGKRTIGLQFDRVIGATGERVGWPAIFGGEQRFLSVFNKVEVPSFSTSLLAVTPYASGIYDNVGGDGKVDSGADIYWKPNGKFQLTATINPDFGQVESDQLVVNFGATETFFSDKRPFFTENQSFFDVPLGTNNTANRLIYTRRVSGDVTAALKFNGSLAGFNYGVFAASEADPTGRDFYALRVTRELATQGFGTMFTQVLNPFIDREADVLSFDHHWNPTAQLSVNTGFVESSIDQSDIVTRDHGEQVRVDYDAGGGWRHQWYAQHLGKDLQLNDFGYLDRNNFNYMRYALSHRLTDLPASSKYASHDWQYVVLTQNNDQGLNIENILALKRQSDLRNGGTEFWETDWISPGHDDLITRGNGAVNTPTRLNLFAERYFPRKNNGRWEFYANVHYQDEGLRSPGHGAIEFDFEPTYHVNDTVSFYGGLDVKHSEDWLIWRDQEQLLGTYKANTAFLSVGSIWLIDSKQELRIKLQAVGLDADSPQAWQVGVDGRPIAVSTPLPNFTLRDMGFQIRYRREIAPLSYIYVAYVRGGTLFDETLGPVDVGHELSRAFDLRDSEQFFVKISYRFEL